MHNRTRNIVHCHIVLIIRNDYHTCQYSVIGVNEYCFCPKGTDSKLWLRLGQACTVSSLWFNWTSDTIVKDWLGQSGRERLHGCDWLAGLRHCDRSVYCCPKVNIILMVAFKGVWCCWCSVLGQSNSWQGRGQSSCVVLGDILLLLCKDDYLISSVGDMCTKRKNKTRSS